jgi:hypothetical protein
MAKLRVEWNGGWLRAMGANNHQECPVPLHNRVDRPSRGTSRSLLLVVKPSAIRLGDLYGETGAQECERNQTFSHRKLSPFSLVLAKVGQRSWSLRDCRLRNSGKYSRSGVRFFYWLRLEEMCDQIGTHGVPTNWSAPVRTTKPRESSLSLPWGRSSQKVFAHPVLSCV